MSDWLKAEEAAAALRVTTDRLYAMVREGQFQHIKWAGREVRIHRSEIEPPVIVPEPDPLCSARIRRSFAEIRQRMDEIEAELAGRETRPVLLDSQRRTG